MNLYRLIRRVCHLPARHGPLPTNRDAPLRRPAVEIPRRSSHRRPICGEPRRLRTVKRTRCVSDGLPLPPPPNAHTHGAVASLSGLQISPPFAARGCKYYEVGFIIFLFNILKLLRICRTLQSLAAPSSLQTRCSVLFFGHVLRRAALLCQVAHGPTEFLRVFPKITI